MWNLRKPGASGPGMAVRLAGLLAVLLVAASCGLAAQKKTGNTPTSGGTATYALQANATIDYIFPFTPGQYFTVVNTDNLQYLLYRPLYWFGDQGQPYLNPGLSLAEPPQYSGQTVTIKLKQGYRWSNNEPVTAQDVLFWMHMMKEVVKHSSSTVNWGGYVPGDFPDNVTNIQAHGQDVVTDDDHRQVQQAVVHLQRTQPDHPDAAGLGQERG